MVKDKVITYAVSNAMISRVLGAILDGGGNFVFPKALYNSPPVSAVFWRRFSTNDQVFVVYQLEA